MVSLGKEQPFERGVSGNGSYLDHEAATSISGGSSQIVYKGGFEYENRKTDK